MGKKEKNFAQNMDNLTQGKTGATQTCPGKGI